MPVNERYARHTVVPIWIVEFIKMHPELWSTELPSSGQVAAGIAGKMRVSTNF